MNRQDVLTTLANARWHDLTQPLSIFTPPFPGEMPLQVHFFKRLTGSWGGGQGANGQLIEWSNNTGTHLVGPRAFHSGAAAIADLPLAALFGPGVVADVSDAVGDYGFYSPAMIRDRVAVREGDILVVHTGYRRYAWDQPDVANPAAQGGVENKEFGYYVRHPGPSPDFFPWALEMKLKVVGVDCGCAEHPMNTNVRRLHPGEFERAAARARETTGKTWDELFPAAEYYALTHREMPRAGLLLLEGLGGDVGEILNRRAWFFVPPLPFLEVESSWSRVVALTPGEGQDDAGLEAALGAIEALDMTLPFSVQTPQWANYEPLSVKYTKRVGGQDLGLGRNNAHCRASFHLATHMDGEKHFWAAGRTIGEVPLDYWHGPGVIADISAEVSDSSVYTPAMIEAQVDLEDGDILLIKTGWHRYGWASPDSDEFRYMIQHPGPSPDFADWCIARKIKWLGIDCVAMEHPMNTIQRIWHPGTFAVANAKLRERYGKDWDEVYPQDKYYQDMHLNLFPKHIVHAENLGGALADAESGRYYIAAFIQRGMELASCWGRFVAFRERLAD
ncbi:MAG: cyclase family protein [Acidobacteriota bacterium]|nr:cyclase family protein [Acidobacteriota bacterium]